MAEYISFEKGIEVGGNDLTIVTVGTLAISQREVIIEKYGLKTHKGAWNDLQALLDTFKEIALTIGEMNLFLFGKSVIESMAFPPMNGLKNALESIDVAYHMNHRKNGKLMFDAKTGAMTEGIGHYKLVKFDEAMREAVMVCHTPYPSKLEEGIILQIVRKYKPQDSSQTKVSLDETRETRRKGGESCTFIISW